MLVWIPSKCPDSYAQLKLGPFLRPLPLRVLLHRQLLAEFLFTVSLFKQLSKSLWGGGGGVKAGS